MRLLLPSTANLKEAQRAYVTIKTLVPLGPSLSLTPTLIEKATAAIADWNLTDDAGNPLPITTETVGELPAEDVHYIASHLKTRQEFPVEDRKRLIIYLSAMRDGRSADEDPPVSYLLYVYRRKFGLSWQELLATPIAVIVQDIEYMNLENQLLRKTEE